MSTMVDDTAIDDQTQTPAERLRDGFTACRLRLKKFGEWKAASESENLTAAEALGADDKRFRGRKKLLESDAGLKKVKNRLKAASDYWKAMSLASSEPGFRYIRREDLAEIDARLDQFKGEIAVASEEYNDCYYQDAVEKARREMGDLFDRSQFPADVSDAFDADWEFVDINPPDYLKVLKPEVYQREVARVQQRLAMVADRAEQEFVEKFSDLLETLTDRLRSGKWFGEGRFSDLQEFFDRFRRLNVTGNEDLERLVDEAKNRLAGVNSSTMQGTKEVNQALRGALATNLGEIQEGLLTMLRDRPRRVVTRKKQEDDD